MLPDWIPSRYHDAFADAQDWYDRNWGWLCVAFVALCWLAAWLVGGMARKAPY